MTINRNYIIFFWIVCLTLFTFYCVFRLKYMSENISQHAQNYMYNDLNNQPNNQLNNQLNKYTHEKYKDVDGPIVTKATITTTPYTTHPADVITYIENIQSKNNIRDMLNCDKLYDDNFKVRELGYQSCGEAYSDYLVKNYDLNNKYDNTNTLAEICPISSKSKEYLNCLNLLIHKFTDNADLVNSINTDMNTSINQRLNARTDNLYKLQSSVNPFIRSKLQNDFNNNMLKKGQLGDTSEDTLNLINTYYQDKYQGGIIETFMNNDNHTEHFTNVIHPDIEKLFFGKYKPTRGQFYNLANLIFTIEYDSLAEVEALDSALKAANLDTSPAQKIPSQTVSSQSPTPLSLKVNSRPVIFTFSDDDIYITYKVANIDYFQKNKSAIQLVLSDKNIIHQSSPTNVVEPLLKQLGLFTPSIIGMVFDTYTSTEEITHHTYKLVNENLDTIIVLEKETSSETTKFQA